MLRNNPKLYTGSDAGGAAASDQTNAISLLQSHSLTTLVQHEIERLIVSGELSVGDKLNEAVLAERLGVSRGPVREAFRALEESGLVRMEKNRGVFVREVSIEEADEIYEVRAALDQLVGRRLAVSIRPEQLKELRGILEHMDQAAAKHDVDAYYPLNLQFHDALVAFTGNKKLLATYRRIVNELNLYRRDTLAAEGDGLLVSTAEHRRIFEAIASGDADRAGMALYDHVTASRERMHRVKGVPETAKLGRTRKAA
jgi:phosphonate utilization transcriptional regulator